MSINSLIRTNPPLVDILLSESRLDGVGDVLLVGRYCGNDFLVPLLECGHSLELPIIVFLGVAKIEYLKIGLI